MGRIRIEAIIVGSLIADFEHYWPEVRSAVPEDCIRDPTLRRIYQAIRKRAEKRQTVNLLTLWQDGADMMHLAELAANHDFETMKWQYNVLRFWTNKPMTNVKFENYVNTLLRYESQAV